MRIRIAVLMLAMMCGVAGAQPAASGAARRMRLYLTDGSYQIVMSYKVHGGVVSFVSAERGDNEDLPAELVDWKATKKWEQGHSPNDEASGAQAPAIDPELLQEEADRRSLTPEVAPDLNLPDLDSVVALDTFHGVPELVPLVQTDGDLNRTTGHNILKMAINPRAAQHQILQLKGEEAAVQMHVAQPVIFLRVGDDAAMSPGGTPLVVDTRGAGAGVRDKAAGALPESGYVMVRADVRTDARVLASFNIGELGNAKEQEDVVETTTELLPGGHWMKVTPTRPLDFGEYALMEVLSDREINTGVWDFGVHPVAAENRDVIKPEPKRPLTLQRRGPE